MSQGALPAIQIAVCRHQTISTNPSAALRSLLGENLCRDLGIYPLPEGLRISVVVPIYNEKTTVTEIVRRIRAVPIAKEIILVDDGSSDGTRDVLAGFDCRDDVRIVLHERNRGKGAAVRTGFQQATGDIVLIQDADLEYDPVRVPAADPADCRGRGRRGLRLALRFHRAAPRALFLALPRQPRL